MQINKIKDILKIYLEKSLYSSKEFNELIFADEKSDNKVLSAITHLNQANTYVNLANIQYLQYCESGECTDFEDVVNKFNVFNNEFLSSYSTNHSLQWTNIEYIQFKEACQHYLSEYY